MKLVGYDLRLWVRFLLSDLVGFLLGLVPWFVWLAMR